MTDKIWQSCFTNTDHINKTAVKSGWTSLLVSASIPNSAYEACVKWQAANSRIENEGINSSDNVYELICDNAYACAIRHRYGLKDNHGRPNMFSHAYIVPMEDFLKNPNCLLTISDDNFCGNQEEAEQKNPDSLSLTYDEDFDISSALQLLSMDKEAYKTLLRTVYVLNADERNLKPLHIELYEDSKKLKALMYLIHIGLPYHIRRNLKIAATPKADTYFRNIVFDKEAKTRGIYIVPETKESNNPLPPSTVFELIDEFASHYDEDEKDIYYKELSDKAIGLGGSGILAERALKIAYAMNNIGDVNYKPAWDDEKLMLRLSDALLYNADMISSLEYKKEFEDFVAAMLKELMERKLAVNENMYERIAVFSARATSEDLKEVWKNLRQYQFEKLVNEEQKIERLALLEANSAEDFIEFSCELINQKRDYKVLKEYFISGIAKSESIEALLKNEAKIIRTEARVTDRASKEEVFNDIHDVLKAKLWDLYKLGIDSADLSSLYQGTIEVYDRLSEVDPAVNSEEAKIKAKQYFWEAFSFEKLEKLGADNKLYNLLSLPQDDSFKLYKDFIDILDEIPQIDIYKSLKDLNEYYNEIIKRSSVGTDRFTDREQNLLKNIFRNFLEKHKGSDYEEGFIEDMVKIAVELNTAVYEEFIDVMENVSGTKDSDYKRLEALNNNLENDELKVVKNKIFNRIYEKFKGIEEHEEKVVKLDSWLALGKINSIHIGEDWFNVFDKDSAKDYKAAVLFDKEIEELLEDSYYFTKCENDTVKNNTVRAIDAAAYYVDDKGQHRSIIHKWVKYIGKRNGESTGGLGDIIKNIKLPNPFAKKKEE